MDYSDENMSHRELDIVPENTLGGSVITSVPTLKISQNDLIRFDGMIGYSDDSSEQSRTSNAIENEQETEVALLVNSKKYHIDIDSHLKNKLPYHKDSVDISRLSSLMNISNLSENIPSNLSIDVQQLFPDVTAEDIQIATALTDSDVGDFSPSDGSDFDPNKAGFNSDDSLIPSYQDEYYDDPVINLLKKKRKRKVKRLQERNIDENCGESSQNLLTNEGVSVMTQVNPDSQENNIEKDAKQIAKKRKWDRRNACFYCQALVTNYTRHLLRNHENEIEVLQYKAINDEDPKVRKLRRQEITNKLRNKGNFLHNSKVCFDQDPELTLLPSKRDRQGSSSPSNYATCKTCLGTFKRSTFFRHLRNCKESENIIPSLKRKALFNNSITIVPNTVQASIELKEKILSHLRSDEISLIVKNDPLIVAYGARLLKKKKERRSRKAICSKMRDLGSLLTILRKKDKTIENLTDAIDPEKYETLVSAIKEMCGFDEQTGMVKVISVPARMRPAVLGCVEILYTQSIMRNDTSAAYKEAYKKKLDDYKRLIEINWEWEISSNAEKSRKRNHLTKEVVMPLDEDIKTVTEKIHKLEMKYATKLKKDRSVLNYELLCTVTIAHIIMLDRKRSGDVAEAELAFYINRKNEEVPEKVLETLTQEQRKCIKDLDVFQIPGKRTRGVPILLTKVMRENIDLIVACRQDLKIPDSNQYLFARPGTQEPFDGGKCLDFVKKLCNLKRPEMITSTGMRHHIATMSQIHATQSDKYTEQLAGFLGHNMSIHAQNYRLPMQVLQKAVVGPQLMEYENTLTEKNNREEEPITSCQEIKNVEEKIPASSSKTAKIDSDQSNILITDPNETIPETIANNNVKEVETEDCGVENDKEQGNPCKQDPKSNKTKVKPNKNRKETSSSSDSDSEDDKPIQKGSKIRSTKENEEGKKNPKKSNIKPNNRKKKIECPKSSSDSDSDSHSPIMKRNKTIHRKWSDEEIKVVKKYFQSYIKKKVNPGKSKCMEVLSKEPILRNRTWMQLNTYVNNIYKKK